MGPTSTIKPSVLRPRSSTTVTRLALVKAGSESNYRNREDARNLRYRSSSRNLLHRNHHLLVTHLLHPFYFHRLRTLRTTIKPLRLMSLPSLLCSRIHHCL